MIVSSEFGAESVFLDVGLPVQSSLEHDANISKGDGDNEMVGIQNNVLWYIGYLKHLRARLSFSAYMVAKDPRRGKAVRSRETWTRIFEECDVVAIAVSPCNG